MNIKRFATLTSLAIAGAALAGCGGNYSNEDVDFQNALPERTDFAISVPQQTLTLEGASEYLRDTRNTVATFNAITNAFLGLIDYVRSLPPTSREPGRRVWGPFPNERETGWLTRMVMSRVDDPRVPDVGVRFEYRIQFQRADAIDELWIDYLWGSYWPSHGVRRGAGDLHLDTRAARTAAYPVDDPADPDDLNHLERLDIEYYRIAHPHSLKVTVSNLPAADHPRASYEYSEAADRSATMLFLLGVKDVRFGDLEVKSRWLGSGVGRANTRFTAVPGSGIDCWDVQGRATYVRRDWEPAKNSGDVATCIPDAP